MFPAAGCQARRRKWRNKPPRHPWRRHGQLTRARVLPTRSGLCNGGGRAAGNESIASIFHTLAARQEPHYPGFQPPGRPCYPQVLSIVSCHIIRPRPRLFIAAPTEFHDSKSTCIRVHAGGRATLKSPVAALNRTHRLQLGVQRSQPCGIAGANKVDI